MMRRFSPLLLILLIPGCLTSGQLGDTPRPPTPTPLLDASGQPIPELEVTGQALPAGTYTRTIFEPRITLDLNGDWEAVQLLEGFFDVQQFKESPDVYAVQFANPTNVDTAEEAVASLRANDDLVELESSTSLIDGQEGLQITVENTSGLTTPLFIAPPGALAINDGRRLWVAFFDTDAGLLAIMVGGSVDQWDEALAAAEPVLESVRIGD